MFRISLVLWLVALAALKLVVLRYSEAVIDLSPKFSGIIGLMPLFDPRSVPWTAHVRAADPPHVRPRLPPQPVQARNHAARGRITAALAWRRRNKKDPPRILASGPIWIFTLLRGLERQSLETSTGRP